MTADTAVLPAAADRIPAPLRRGWFRQLGIDSAYVLTGFPISLAAFVVVVTGLTTGMSLVIVWVGIPLVALTLVSARGFATAERLWLPSVLRARQPVPAYRRADPDSSPIRRSLTPLSDPQCWLDALHAVLRLVVSTPAFSVVVTWWAGALGGLTYGAWDWSLPHGPDDGNGTLPVLLGLGDSPAARIAVNTVLGVVFAATIPFATRAMAVLQAQFSRVLLTLRAATQAELGRLSEGRDAAVAAEAVALRRLERDIHDGPQQRLVRLGMDLSRVQRQLDRDPEAARTTLGEATALARETLEELRALSRGIAPPVLADRGLAAALAAIAARSPVPVELDTDLPERLAPVTENTAYFVVSEALANVAKHSDAGSCRIAVRCAGDRLAVVIEDDGTGGAVLAPGHGLAGLADRLRAVDGVLTVDSPRGGPTRLTAELPCA